MSDIIKTRKKLSDLPKGAQGVVIAISHSDKKVKNRLHAIGVCKGCAITRLNNANPVIVETSGAEVALGREFADHIIVETGQKVIFLLGNPNVGKSTIFSRLTGVKTDASNYPGTSVSLLSGEAKFNKTPYTIYDMPAAYSLEEECQTSAEACVLLKNAPYDLAVYVADAQHLERNLFFALDIINLGKPVVLLLNKFDVAEKKGINIDIPKLSQMLGVPVIACNGLTGMGLKELAATVEKLSSGKMKYRPQQIPAEAEDKWKLIGLVSAQAQKITHRHPSLLERLEAAASTPLTGIPIALIVMALAFLFVLNAGEFLINILTPLYQNYYLPFMENLFAFSKDTILWTILFGSKSATASGFGVLSEGARIAFINVLCYVLAFYAVLDFLTDLGYLPRLAILLDGALHKIGLHGYSAIPVMLGFGCKVPAVMAARALETRRQRIIAFALILMMAPCISQTAMMFTVLAPHGTRYLLLVFAIMAAAGILVSAVLNKMLKGDTSDIFMEIPSWQLPKPKLFLKKLLKRAKDYVFGVAPLIILGMLFITLADITGIMGIFTEALKFPLQVLMGLPADTAPVIVLGFLKKDISIALLIPFNLSAKQLVIACVFMAMYLPCVGSFFVLLKEAGWKDTARIITITLSVSLVIAALLNLIM